MKTFRIFPRFILFTYQDPWTWVGYHIVGDYHNIIISITILTINIGFEYVRKNSNISIKKYSYGWDIMKLPK